MERNVHAGGFSGTASLANHSVQAEQTTRARRLSLPWVAAACLLCLFLTAGCEAPMPTGPQLTAISQAVDLLRASVASAAKPLQQGEMVPLGARDRVSIDDKGRARIDLENAQIDLFRNSSVQVTDVKLRPSGDMLLHLWQDAGIVEVQHLDAPNGYIVLGTEDAVFEPGPGAQLIVCHAPDVMTCMISMKGTTKLTVNGTTYLLGPGESRYILAGKPLSRVICVNPEQMRIWLERLRSNQPIDDPGAMVADWDKHGCGNAAAPAREAAVTPSAPVTTAVAATPIAATAAVTTALAVTEPMPLTGTIAPSASGMVQIPAGTYVIGVAQPDKSHIALQAIDLPGFWIDITETTNFQYAKFVSATGRVPPATWGGGAPPAGKDNNPAEGLSFGDAQAYCAWAGKRLPKEAEWEVATRGPGAKPPLYPWGDDPTDNGAAFNLPQVDSYPVGTVAFNASKFGVFDTIGNVWEWTTDPYAPIPDGTHILRGGRHDYLADGAFRQPVAGDNPRFRAVAGVRCAADGIAKETTP